METIVLGVEPRVIKKNEAKKLRISGIARDIEGSKLKEQGADIVVCEPCALMQVVGNAANQETRVQSVVLKYPCQQ